MSSQEGSARFVPNPQFLKYYDALLSSDNQTKHHARNSAHRWTMKSKGYANSARIVPHEPKMECPETLYQQILRNKAHIVRSQAITERQSKSTGTAASNLDIFGQPMFETDSKPQLSPAFAVVQESIHAIQSNLGQSYIDISQSDQIQIDTRKYKTI